MGLVNKAKNLNPRRLVGGAWNVQKKKAAVFVKITEMMGGKHITNQVMKRNWYRHIDKAMEGKATEKDEKHWKKMLKTFKHELVGVPNPTTAKIMRWLETMPKKIRFGELSKGDKAMLPTFRAYMQSCTENYANLYIEKNKLMEV